MQEKITFRTGSTYEIQKMFQIYFRQEVTATAQGPVILGKAKFALGSELIVVLVIYSFPYCDIAFDKKFLEVITAFYQLDFSQWWGL